ncbi:hypothetical protein BC940DRAFT_221545, partial [Gongronella butleri]
KLLPKTALDDVGKVVYLSLSNIPNFKHDQGFSKTTEHLFEALSVFGKVIDLGLLRDQSNLSFQGHGYALLQQMYDIDEYPEFGHVLSLGKDSHNENSSNYCHVVTRVMKPWCRYCHAEDHIIRECPKKKAATRCYQCNNFGHTAAECKDKAHNSKKPRKT